MKLVKWQCEECKRTGKIETNGDPWKASSDAQREHDQLGLCKSQKVYPLKDADVNA